MAKSFKKIGLVTGSVKKPKRPAKLSQTPRASTFSSRQELVKATERRLKQVENKLDRHEAKGVKVIGSQYDPRSKALPKNMTGKQLQSYLGKLDSFMSRSRQYEGDASGNPIPAAVMREYRQQEKKYNAHIKRELNKIANIQLPHMDMTLGSRMDKVVGKSRFNNMTNGMNRLSELNRNSNAFFSAESVGKAIANMRRKLSKDYKSRTAEANRNSWEALIEYSSRPDLLKLTRQLTDDEFQMLADYSPMFSEAAANYSQWLRYQSDAQNASQFQGQVDELYEMIEDQMRFVLENRRNG